MPSNVQFEIPSSQFGWVPSGARLVLVLCGVSDDCDDMEISGAPGLVIWTSASSLSPGSWEGWLQAGLISGWLGSPSQYEKTGSRDQLVWSLTAFQLSASWSRADSSPDITNHHLATWGVGEFSELVRWAPLRRYLRCMRQIFPGLTKN